MRAAEPPGWFLYFTPQLKIKLKRKLHQARIFHLSDLAKLRAIRAVAVWVIELGMVEYVESFCAKFEVFTVVDWNDFYQSKIGFADSGSAADRAWCAADVTEYSRLREDRSLAGRRIEIVVPVLLRPLPRKGSDLIGLARQFKVETVHQLIVGFRCDANRKPGLVGRDARHRPVIEHLSGKAAIFSRGQLPEITDDKTVACVKQRESAVVGAGKGIENSFKAGGFVDRFAEGISGGELQAVGKALLERNLQRVVSRIGNGVLGKDAAIYRNSIGRTAHASEGITLRRRIGAQADEIQSLPRPVDNRPIGHMELETSGDSHGKGSVLVKLDAGARAIKCVDVKTGLRIRVVDIVRRQQAVPLRSNVANFQLHVPGQLPLDGEVVLCGIL